MIESLLLTLCTLFPSGQLDPAPEPTCEPSASLAAQDGGKDIRAEYTRRRGEAQGDIEKLWKLVDWCEANSLVRERKQCLHAILKIDENDKKGHELLGHVFYDGQWFTTEKKLAAYKKKEKERLAKAKGWVRYKGDWIDPKDISYIEKGMVKGEDGRWYDPEELKHLEEGWVQQDLMWIPPDEVAQMEAGLWKCGEEWLSLDEANKYHAQLGTWWVIPGQYFVIYSTLERDVALQALGEIDRTFGVLVGIYGVRPSASLHVAVLNSADQYSQFAAGSDELGWRDTDATGLSGVHGAFFADAWFDPTTRKWMGAGAGYWDNSTEVSARVGRTFARHAAGQSFGEFADPSPKAIEKLGDRGRDSFNPDAFWGEKRIPAWYRYGAATYVERYMVDSTVDSGGDPHWLRPWSISNILNKGGLDSFSQIFEMSLAAGDPARAGKLVNEAGLLIAFALDGKCGPVKEKHQALKVALKSGKKTDKAFANLEKAIEKHEKELRLWANL